MRAFELVELLQHLPEYAHSVSIAGGTRGAVKTTISATIHLGDQIPKGWRVSTVQKARYVGETEQRILIKL